MLIDPNFNAKLEAIAKARSDGELSDNVSIYIGFSLLTLGFLNGITDVPDSFIIGASISGFCFAMIDIIILGDTLKKLIKPLTVTGIFSLFLLPIILTLYPYPLLLDFFKIYSDMGTFLALGFVMIALGIKSRNAKQGFITMTIEVIEQLKNNNAQIRKEFDIHMKEYAELKEEYHELVRGHKEMMDDFHTKMTNYEEELDNIKGAPK